MQDVHYICFDFLFTISNSKLKNKNVNLLANKFKKTSDKFLFRGLFTLIMNPLRKFSGKF